MNVKKYCVVEQISICLLNESVNEKIKSKWIPQGGINVINVRKNSRNSFYYYQAMVLLNTIESS